MFVLTTAIAVIAFIATSQGGQVWDGYAAKWAEKPEDGFYHLPQRLKTAECRGWTEIPGCTVPSFVKALGYKGDPRFIILFLKTTGKPIGHQIGFPVADVKGVPINYDSNPALTKLTLNGTDYYTGTALYGQDERTNAKRIWLMINGKPVEIPTNATQMILKTSYYMKRCVTWMGLHAYAINSTTNCSTMLPWATLIIDGEIIGLFFQVVGTARSAPGRRWYENKPLSLLSYLIPDAPTCLVEGLTTHGAISMHVWFRDNPLGITCKDECTPEYNSTYVKKSFYGNSDDQCYEGSEGQSCQSAKKPDEQSSEEWSSEKSEEKSSDGSEQRSAKRFKRSESSGNFCPA